jgi:glutamate synthase (NADPH/NADH) large chain
MSGGIAWVYNPDNSFAENCNKEMVDLDPLSEKDSEHIIALLKKHVSLTGSKVAKDLLKNWDEASTKFVKVFPKEYKKVILKAELQTIS